MSNSTGCQAAYHSICVNPTGTLEPCCQYTPDDSKSTYRYNEFEQYINDIPTQMHLDASAGIEHAGCQKCYREEKHGWRSLRQWQNDWYPSDVTKVSVHNPIYDLELRLGNFCNLKCIMCGPDQSSSIAAERHTHQEKFIQFGARMPTGDMPYYWKEEDFKQFAQTILTKNARRVNITGGEPFIIPEVVKFLEMLVPRADDLTLSFNTNLTEVSAKLLAMLQKFKRVNINISLEGIGAMNDYIRYPSRWADIESNIQLLKKELPQARLEINHVLQHTSVYALPSLVDFAKQHKLHVQITTVSGYPYLTLDSVPEQDLDAFKSWAEQNTTLNQAQQSLIVNMACAAKFDTALYQKFKEYINLLDSIRGTGYSSVFLESR
jgi:sulfatase maturation enzyme AslB (radical SAM superfamily)